MAPTFYYFIRNTLKYFSRAVLFQQNMNIFFIAKRTLLLNPLNILYQVILNKNNKSLLLLRDFFFLCIVLLREVPKIKYIYNYYGFLVQLYSLKGQVSANFRLVKRIISTKLAFINVLLYYETTFPPFCEVLFCRMRHTPCALESNPHFPKNSQFATLIL